MELAYINFLVYVGYTIVVNNNHFQIEFSPAKVVSIVANTTMLPAWLAQSVEHETLNLMVVGSSPTLGAGVLPHLFQRTYCF